MPGTVLRILYKLAHFILQKFHEMMMATKMMIRMKMIPIWQMRKESLSQGI